MITRELWLKNKINMIQPKANQYRHQFAVGWYAKYSSIISYPLKFSFVSLSKITLLLCVVALRALSSVFFEVWNELPLYRDWLESWSCISFRIRKNCTVHRCRNTVHRWGDSTVARILFAKYCSRVTVLRAL